MSFYACWKKFVWRAPEYPIFAAAPLLFPYLPVLATLLFYESEMIYYYIIKIQIKSQRTKKFENEEKQNKERLNARRDRRN